MCYNATDRVGLKGAVSDSANMLRDPCRLLRKRGYSIGQIARKLQVSESTVHWHVKNIHLTGAQREKLRSQKRELMAKVNARRRGQPLKPVLFRKPKWSRALIHLIAHLGFDGRIDRYGCYYYSRSYPQARHVRRSLKRLLGIAPQVRLRPNGIWVVSFCNVSVAAWLASKERELLQVARRRQEWQRQWLQALFDDEGHLHISKSLRRVRASQQDPQVLHYARGFLGALGISSRVDPQAQAVEITGRSNLIRFTREVGFSPGICVNRHRKNGLWDQELEKRDLLQRALHSYRS